MRIGLFTIIAKNYLAYARVLMDSVRRHAPDAQRFVILVDRVDGYFNPAEEQFEVLSSDALGLPDSRWFHFKYTILELSTAVKPYAAEFLFRRYDLDQLVYLDPDIRYYATMEPLWRLLEDSNILLTPHLTRPLDDGMYPGDLDILRSGSYNLGFVGLSRSEQTFEFLKWWQAKLYEHCVVDLARGLFVDQRWIDLAPGLFDGVRINREPGYNVAYWNLKHRAVTRVGEDYLVNGQQLYFFHFSGFDPLNPIHFSRHQNRFKLEDLGVGLPLVDEYRNELLEAGYRNSCEWPYGYGRFANGFAIPDMGRPAHHESPELVRQVSDPFSEAGYEAFLNVWNEPVVSDTGERIGLTRLAYRIYRIRLDVQAAMPDVLGADRLRFLEWILISGRREHGLDNAFLTPIWDALGAPQHATSSRPSRRARVKGALSPQADQAVRQAEGVWMKTRAPKDLGKAGLNELIEGGQAGLKLTRLAGAIYKSRRDLQNRMPDPCGRDAIAFLTWFLTYGKYEYDLDETYLAPLRQQWKAILNGQSSWVGRVRRNGKIKGMEYGLRARLLTGGALTRLRFARAFGRLLVAGLVNARQNKAAGIPEPPVISDAFGVNIVGHLQAETGVGESARSAIMAAKTATIPVHAKNLTPGGPYRLQTQHGYVNGLNGDIYKVSIFHVNADETPRIFRSGEVTDVAAGYNVGYWAWELEEFPDRFMPAFAYYREIWTPSTFCQATIARKSPIPVIHVPHAVKVTRPEGMGRAYFGLADDEIVFLTLFDMLSVFERKNPMGAVRAFARAFGYNDPCRLVVKVNHAEHGAAELEQLAEAARGQKITLLTGTMTREEISGLMGCCDCLVSLHRSEGFGLTLAEAMYQGKPVIATGYSGNVDFTRDENAMIVSYKIRPVGKGCEPYPEDAVWAEPDEEDAARHMTAIAASKELRVKLGGVGQEWVRTHLSGEAVGRLTQARLKYIRERLCSASERDAMGAPDLDQIDVKPVPTRRI